MTTAKENGEFVTEIIRHLNASDERAAKATHVREAVRQLDAALTANEAVEIIATALIDANERSYMSQMYLYEYMTVNGASWAQWKVRKDRQPMTNEEWAEVLEAMERIHSEKEEVTS